MAADAKLQYGTSDQAITVTLASLADAAYRESTAIDNATNEYVDALVGGKVTTGTSPTTNTQIVVFCYGSVDGGTLYSGNATGSDAAYTASDNKERNLAVLGVINVGSTSDVSYEFGPWSVAAAFGGSLPSNWGLIFKNETGAALNSTGGNHDINYQGIWFQST